MRAARGVRRGGCAAALLSALACAHAPASHVQAVAEVVRALDDLHDAAARGDEERYFGHFSDTGVFLGTDASERWDLPAFRAYAHPHFAKGQAWKFKGVRRRIAVRGDLAWFEEDLETENLGPARGSGVLIWSKDRWLIEQYVLSITIPNHKFKSVKEVLDR